MRSVSSVVAPVADTLLISDLPRLPRDARAEVVVFTCARVAGLPGPTRTAVLAAAFAHRGLLAVPGGEALLAAVAARPLPLVGEYVRLLRSLATAYVWETWPDTAPDGAPRSGAA